MRKAVVFLVIFLLLTLISGCAQPPAPLAYAERGFSANISGSADGQKFEAAVIASARGEGERDISVEFFLPETLRGIKVERRGGEICVKRGEFEIENFRGEGWLILGELLLGEGEIIKAERRDKNVVATVRGEGQVTEITVGGGVPVCLQSGGDRDIDIKVLSFSGEE